MEREQNKLIPRTEIKKDRVVGYPFHIVTATYSTSDLHFIVAADNIAEVLSLYPFKSDMTKLITSTIPLSNILSKKLMATLHIVSLTVKPTTGTSVVIQHAELIIGYRTGQLVLVEYKDKDCKVKQRYNKALKGESLFSRASSAFFGSDEHYNPYFGAPIRSFSVYPSLGIVWQVGNNIFIQKQLNEGKQNKFLHKYQSLKLQNFYLNYDMYKIVKQGNLLLFGCDQYTTMEYPELNMSLIAFKLEITTFMVLAERKELMVTFSSKETIFIIDLQNHFVVKSKIHTELPIRRLNYFEMASKPFLLLMPYENYLIVYSLASNSYCRLRGHKSFIANAIFNPQSERIITAGLDHQICLIKLASIKEESWIGAQKCPQREWRIKETDGKDQRFEDVYLLGQANSNRSNLYSYGYGGVFPFNGHFCFPTYDSKILIYSL